jgi:hypothetical protein
MESLRGYSANTRFERTREAGWKLPTTVMSYTPVLVRFSFLSSVVAAIPPTPPLSRREMSQRHRLPFPNRRPLSSSSPEFAGKWRDVSSAASPHSATFFAPCWARSPSVCNPRPRFGLRR